jgi:gluconolactonase
MNLSAASFLSALGLGATFSPFEYFGLNQQPAAAVYEAATLASENPFLIALPAEFEQLSISFVRNNLAVIPGDWEAGDISQNTPVTLIESKLINFQKHPFTISSRISRLSKMH